MAAHSRAQQLIALMASLIVGSGAVLWHVAHRPPGPEMGVSRALARERAGRIRDLQYAVSLTIPRARSGGIEGRLRATFSLQEIGSALVMDFRQPSTAIRQLVVNDRDLVPAVTNGHIVLPTSSLRAGENIVDITFAAGEAALNRHEDYLYSLFVPARASSVFPCFDQPDLKARWTLTLDMPAEWTAVTNSRETGRVTVSDRLNLLFAETAPLPTYLFAFAAGRFSVDTLEVGARRLRVLHRETDPDTLSRNREAIAALHRDALHWLETYTAQPYPFDTFDIVLLPAFQFSGMEHPGAVYYNASSILLDPSATAQQLLNRAHLIAHETAHMWFGNLVTMTWFDDVWMKEVFANLMADRIVTPSFPDVPHDLRFLYQHVPVAYDVDRTAGANPIRQDLDDLDEAGSLYGPIVYQKAPVAMRQLELAIGGDTFRDGLREYLQTYRFGNAGWSDLVTLLDRRTAVDVAAWSQAWIQRAGRPTVRTVVETEGGRIVRLAFAQDDAAWWPERLLVHVNTGGQVRAFDVALDRSWTNVPEAAGLPAPAWILPLGRGLEYGFFDLDPATLSYLSTRLTNLRDPLLRGSAAVGLWESMLEGRVEPDRLLRLLLSAVAVESEPLNVEHLLDRIQTLFWRFTGPDERPSAAALLEPVLRRGLDRAASAPARSAWFKAFRQTATSQGAVAWLHAVWRRAVTVPGLTFSETDDADLALELALRDVADAVEVLEAQRARLSNPDRRARFEFLMPSVSADSAVRDAFFESLASAEARTHEAWVIDAARYLHHPLRAAASRRYIRRALEWLPEIQRTGDIFFPKRWADATLAGYQSVQTAADVRAFIDARPAGYPARLKWVLLAAADPLFRAARLQQQ